MKYWLMKSEADVYGIDHLKKDKKAPWEGVRNYQARNFMTTDMSLGDGVLFYHSNSDPTGVVGLAKVVSAAHPDETQFDKKSEFHEPAATREKPRWYCVDVGFVSKFKEAVTLDQLRGNKKLANMRMLQRGNRLSITPVSKEEFAEVCRAAGEKAPF